MPSMIRYFPEALGKKVGSGYGHPMNARKRDGKTIMANPSRKLWSDTMIMTIRRARSLAHLAPKAYPPPLGYLRDITAVAAIKA